MPKTSSEKGTWELTAPTVGSKWGAFTVVTGKKITVTSNGTDISVDAPMLFVPQELTAWDVKKTKAEADTEHQAYLEIACKIKQEGVYLYGSASEYKTLYVPFGTKWDQGKCYTYTLIFGGGYDDHGLPILQPINFEAETGDWPEPDATEINVNK